MPTFKLTDKEGRSYKVTAPDADSAYREFAAAMGGGGAPASSAPAGDMNDEFAALGGSAAPGDPSVIPGALNAAADAATFGLGDRAYAAGRSAQRVPQVDDYGRILADAADVGPRPTYDQALADKRAETKKFSEEHPAVDIASRLVGGGGAAAGLMKGGATLLPLALEKGVPFLPRVGLMASEGALYGGADALGHGTDLNHGMAVGGLTGAALPTLGAMAGGAYRAGSAMFAPAVDGLNRAATRVANQIVGPDTPFKLWNLGDLASVADAGPAARGVASGVVGKPGPAADRMGRFFEGREAGTSDRVRGAFDNTLGPAVSPEAFNRDLKERLGSESGRLYAQALRGAEPVDIAPIVQGIEARQPEAGGDVAKGLNRAHTMLTEPAPPPPEGTEGLIAQVGRSAPTPPPPTLARFIAANGGLEPSEELTHLGLDKMVIPGVGKVVRPGGKPLDGHWREALIERNYLNGDTDGVGMQRDIRDELYALLGEEQRGNKIYPQDYQPPVRADRAEQALRADELEKHKGAVVRELLQSGLGQKEINPEAVDHAAAMLAAGSELHPGNAYERAVIEGAGLPPAAPPADITVGPSRVPKTNPRQLHNEKQALDKLAFKGDPELFLDASTTGDPAFPYGSIRHDLNQALEDQIPGSYRPGVPETPEGLPAIPGEFRPGYGHANAVGSAYHGEQGAFQSGQEALGNKQLFASDVAGEFGTIPSYQQKAYAQGLRSGIHSDIGNNPDPLRQALSMVRAPEKRGKLEAVFGDAPVGTLGDRLEAERTMRDTFSQVMRGSNTQNKLAGRQMVDEAGWPDIPANATAFGSTGHIGLKALHKAYELLAGKASDATRESLANFFTMGPAQRDRVVAALLDAQGIRQGRQELISGLGVNRGALAAALAGRSAGSPSAGQRP